MISKKEAYIATFKFFKTLHKLKLVHSSRIELQQWNKVRDFLKREFNGRDDC